MPSLNRRQIVQFARARFQAAPTAAGPGSTAPMARRAGPVIGAHRAASRTPTAPDPDPQTVIDPLAEAIVQAVEMWRVQARLDGVVINGPTASGGRLVGPDLDALVRSQATARVPQPGAHPWVETIAGAVGACWNEWSRSFSVPGLPWYPSFAAVPMPVAPPTPNVPTPLLPCIGRPDALGERALDAAMRLRDPNPHPRVGALYAAMAHGLATACQTWMSAQVVSNVMGRGPVPSYAPPMRPVGPVTAGTILSTPGHLTA